MKCSNPACYLDAIHKARVKNGAVASYLAPAAQALGKTLAPDISDEDRHAVIAEAKSQAWTKFDDPSDSSRPLAVCQNEACVQWAVEQTGVTDTTSLQFCSIKA